MNVRSGGRTRLAAYPRLRAAADNLFLAPLRSDPAGRAGGIMVVAVRMVDREAFRRYQEHQVHTFVLLLTMFVTILFDLILAIEVGLVAAAILFIVRMSNMFTVNPESLSGNGRYRTPGPRTSVMHKQVVAYRVDGPIFFGAAERFIDQLVKVDSDIKVVVLRLKRVPVMDATGVTALRAINDRLTRQNIALLVSGLQPQPALLKHGRLRGDNP